MNQEGCCSLGYIYGPHEQILHVTLLILLWVDVDVNQCVYVCMLN